MSDKTIHEITGIEKRKIMDSRQQFVELPSGDIINKSFIVTILLDKEKTKMRVLSLSYEERKALFEGKIPDDIYQGKDGYLNMSMKMINASTGNDKYQQD
jgi:hypothetical protein